MNYAKNFREFNSLVNSLLKRRFDGINVELSSKTVIVVLTTFPLCGPLLNLISRKI